MMSLLAFAALTVAQVPSPTLPSLFGPHLEPGRFVPVMESSGFYFAACRTQFPADLDAHLRAQFAALSPADMPQEAAHALKRGYAKGMALPAAELPTSEACGRMDVDIRTRVEAMTRESHRSPL